MIIAVASGKGGTGKTTVATSLALSLAASQSQDRPANGSPLFLDCDVEAPNAHIFLVPEIEERREVGIMIPQVDETRCTSCGKCAEVCQYHAIAVLGKKTLVFPQLCHGCGSCTWICPEDAISETLNVIGVLEHGTARRGIDFGRGILNVGEPMAVPLIRQLKNWLAPEPGGMVIIDVPPGTSCPVVEAVRNVNYLILVTEPTPYGLHDLKLITQVAHELNIQAGVLINRDGIGDASVEEFCASEGLPVLMRIPFERAIAEGIAQGKALLEIRPEYADHFLRLFAKIT